MCLGADAHEHKDCGGEGEQLRRCNRHRFHHHLKREDHSPLFKKAETEQQLVDRDPKDPPADGHVAFEVEGEGREDDGRQPDAQPVGVQNLFPDHGPEALEDGRRAPDLVDFVDE